VGRIGAPRGVSPGPSAGADLPAAAGRISLGAASRRGDDAKHAMKRVLIIADDAFVVHAIRLTLRGATDLDVVGSLDGRGPVGARLLELHPDLVIVDDMENPDDALDRLREVGKVLPDAAALLLTLRCDREWTDQALAAGAQTVLSKTVHPVVLGAALRAAKRPTAH
jgi:DNA-binding NarL/FixJ family response regulator